MSLALNTFFWDAWSGVAAPPPPAPAPAPTPSDGGGGGSSKNKKGKHFFTAPDDFWAEREKQLKNLVKGTDSPIAPAVPQDIQDVPPPESRKVASSPLSKQADEASLQALSFQFQSTLNQAEDKLADLNIIIQSAYRLREEQKRLQIQAQLANERKLRGELRKQKLQSLQKAGEALLKALNNLNR